MLRRFAPPFTIGLFVWILLVFAFFWGLFETWQLGLSDTLFTQKKSANKIVIIAIDNPSIQKIGRWPWSRTVHADLVSKLAKVNTKAIGIDISFLEPESDVADQALAAAIKSAGNVTLAAEISGKDVLSPIPVLADEARVGLANTFAGTDGVTRHAILKLESEGDEHLHFGASVLGLTSDDISGVALEGNLLRINFQGTNNTFKKYSFADVLEDDFDLEVFRDQIVLVGATAADLHDNQITPTSYGTPMDGVEIQANVINTIASRNFITVEAAETTVVNMLSLAGVGAIVFAAVSPLAGGILVIGGILAYVVYAIISFDSGVIINLVFPPLTLILVFITDLIYKYFTEFRQKKFIKKAFSYYLSEDVMDELLQDPDKLALGGERKMISVLFSDIAGFTSISERTQPEKLVHLLNEYLTQMTDIVFKYNGVLDKYIGDAIMAFWGAPLQNNNHAKDAVGAAVEMKEALVKIKKRWASQGISGFDVRIGVNTGEMIVGNMGSQARFDYTLIGDNVNLGARLESINKQYGTQILISSSTHKQIKNDFITRRVDTVAVKGKSKGVAIFEVRGKGKPESNEKIFLDEFEKARKLYQKGEFKKARAIFVGLSRKHPKDGPLGVYLERLGELSKKSAGWKAKNWDGVFRAQSK